LVLAELVDRLSGGAERPPGIRQRDAVRGLHALNLAATRPAARGWTVGRTGGAQGGLGRYGIGWLVDVHDSFLVDAGVYATSIGAARPGFRVDQRRIRTDFPSIVPSSTLPLPVRTRIRCPWAALPRATASVRIANPAPWSTTGTVSPTR